MDFFGTFTSGPLAGSSFTGSFGDGGGEDGGIIFAFAGIGIAITFGLLLIIGPIAIWPLMFKEFSEDYGVVPVVILCIIDFVYCVLRFRSSVRGWAPNFKKELIFGTVFRAFLIATVSLGVIDFRARSMGVSIDWSEAFAYMGEVYGLDDWFILFFVAFFLAIIPSAIITKLSKWTVKKINKAIRA